MIRDTDVRGIRLSIDEGQRFNPATTLSRLHAFIIRFAVSLRRIQSISLDVDEWQATFAIQPLLSRYRFHPHSTLRVSMTDDPFESPRGRDREG